MGWSGWLVIERSRDARDGATCGEFWRECGVSEESLSSQLNVATLVLRQARCGGKASYLAGFALLRQAVAKGSAND